jgi:hypothetical protein
MTSTVLISLYFAAGAGCAVYHHVRVAGRAGSGSLSSLLLVPLWPLWAPFALTPAQAPAGGPITERVAASLAGAPATAQTPGVLERRETAMLLKEVSAAEQRLVELEAQIATLKQTTTFAGLGPEAAARARLRDASVSQLERLWHREHTALHELAELCDLLRAQHLLARFDGTTEQDDFRQELWARVRALSELGGSLGP